MPMVWLAALLLGSGFAIAGGQGWGRKSLNAAIILGSIGLGLGLGYAAGLGTQNFGRVPNAALPVGLIFGIVGAVGCMVANRSR
jgi:hypothetical protein